MFDINKINFIDLSLGVSIGWVIGAIISFMYLKTRQINIQNTKNNKNYYSENKEIFASLPQSIVINIMTDHPDDLKLTDLSEIIIDYDKWKEIPDKKNESKNIENDIDYLNEMAAINQQEDMSSLINNNNIEYLENENLLHENILYN